MYYVISEGEGKILVLRSNMSQAIIDDYAAYYQCSVYAILGNPTGFSAEYPARSQGDEPSGG